MNAKGYQIIPESQTIQVCAYCHPGRSVLVHCPELAGVSYYSLSHGICQTHLAEMKQQINRQQPEVTKFFTSSVTLAAL